MVNDLRTSLEGFDLKSISTHTNGACICEEKYSCCMPTKRSGDPAQVKTGAWIKRRKANSSQIEEVSVSKTLTPVTSHKTKLANVRVSVRRRMKMPDSFRTNRNSSIRTSKIAKLQNYYPKVISETETNKTNPMHSTRNNQLDLRHGVLEKTEHVVGSVTF